MGGFSNPFDVPLNSEIEESRQRQEASLSANGNPFDEPLASEVAERAHTEAKQHLSDNGNPFDVPLDSEIAEQKAQQEASKPNLVDKWIANPSTVPNARIRNLPNPAEGMTPGQALTNGVKTGAELGAIPASAIGLGELPPSSDIWRRVYQRSLKRTKFSRQLVRSPPVPVGCSTRSNI